MVSEGSKLVHGGQVLGISKKEKGQARTTGRKEGSNKGKFWGAKKGRKTGKCKKWTLWKAFEKFPATTYVRRTLVTELKNDRGETFAVTKDGAENSPHQ